MPNPPPVPAIQPSFPNALCRSAPGLFDPRQSGEVVPRRRRAIPRHERALELCNACEHVEECQIWALRYCQDDTYGRGPVMGAMTSGERRATRKAWGVPDPAKTAERQVQEPHQPLQPRTRKCGHPAPRGPIERGCPVCRRERDRERQQALVA